jgi:hypothetical protein
MNNATVDTELLMHTYEKLIQKLNVPEDRKAATPLNARWFIRQGYVQNRNSPLAQDVLDLARKIA